MIYRPDEKVMRAIAALKGNENFRIFSLFLAECLDRTHEEEDKAVDDYVVRWRQGQAQDLRELLLLIEQSKSL